MNRLSPEMIQSHAGQRRKMVEEQLVERGIKDLRVLEAMSRVPRHLFAQESLQHRAYGLNYMNIVFKMFDGTYGWPDQAPFDAILVTASAKEIPESLIKQLGEGGRLVAPTGDADEQKLVVLTKNGSRVSRRELGACKFVPLIGKYGWPT